MIIYVHLKYYHNYLISIMSSHLWKPYALHMVISLNLIISIMLVFIFIVIYFSSLAYGYFVTYLSIELRDRKRCNRRRLNMGRCRKIDFLRN